MEDYFGKPNQYGQERQRRHIQPAERRSSEYPQATGRYSGEALRPEQLLDQLDRSPSYHRAQNQDVRTKGSDDRGNESERYPTLPTERTRRASVPHHRSPIPRELWEKRRRFVDISPGLGKPEELWVILQDIMRDYYAIGRGIDNLGRDMVMNKQIYFWLLHVCRRWLDTLQYDTKETHDGTVSDIERLPSPSVILKASSIAGLSPPTTWRRVLWLFARKIAESDAVTPASFISSKRIMRRGTHELINIWNVCMASKLQRPQAPLPGSLDELLSPPTIDWSFLPDSAAFTESLLQRPMRHRSLEEAIALLVPYVTREAFAASETAARDPKSYDGFYESAALVTFDILQRLKAEGAEDFDYSECEPWSEFMKTVLKSIKDESVPGALAERMKRTDNEEIRSYLKALVNRLDSRYSQMSEERLPKDQLRGSVDETQLSDHQGGHYADTEVDSTVKQGMPSISPNLEQPAPLTDKSKSTDRFATLCISRLGKALQGHNLMAARTILGEVRNFSSQHAATRLPPALYEHLMSTFLSLRSSPTATEVWNEMIQAGHQPTSKTFTVMMSGSAYVRDWTGMENYWVKMRQAGVQPDSHAWSVLVFALLRRGNLDAGLRALHEMGQEWLAAARAARDATLGLQRKKKNLPQVQPSELLAQFEGDVNGVPRPNLVIMNSAISALAASVDEAIPRVLSWGRYFSIEPDVITYNVLLNIAWRHNMPEESLNIFKRMSEQGIEANSTTWTVLLTAMFEVGFIDHLGPEEQKDKILNFIISIESAGSARIDGKGYALIIDRLLKVYNNTSAAQAVLTRMAESGVQPDRFIYTILMASYFNQVPPNFAAAESLWSQLQSSNSGYGAELDSRFYDRMLEGYARHYQAVGIAPMLHFLSRMDSEGKKASWAALGAVARALADARDWERLSDLVDRVRKSLKDTALNEVQRWKERDFWEFIISTGILRDEGITTPAQVRESERWER